MVDDKIFLSNVRIPESAVLGFRGDRAKSHHAKPVSNSLKLEAKPISVDIVQGVQN
jgi:hypothetical protein